jgi:hypothetical protein
VQLIPESITPLLISLVFVVFLGDDESTKGGVKTENFVIQDKVCYTGQKYIASM